jgi:nucleoside-triphosphatase THEP1
MKSFHESGKQHLLITGNKKSGKTTVLNEILKEELSYGGIITYAIRDEMHAPRCVVLRDINDPDINGIIAVRNEAGTSLLPQTDTFDQLGVNILSKYYQSGVELIVIDEIGFLENNALHYQNEIIKCFDKKVFATIRKELTVFTEKLMQRQDVFFVDIDHIDLRI